MYTSFTDWDAGLHLAHHGIKGQKWGQRRFQNEDGSLTAAGRAHYGVAEGGNKKLARLYNRQSRKLERLRKKTDMNLQRANAEKYDKRAKIGFKVGNAAAGVALASIGGSHALRLINNNKKAIAKGIIDENYRKADEAVSRADKYVHDMWKSDKQAYTNGKWNGKGYSDETWNKIRSYEKNLNAEHEGYMNAAKKTRDEFNAGAEKREKASNIGQTVAKASAGVAAVSYGYSAINKILSSNAKKRLTAEGHDKAVKKYKAQIEKMIKTFDGTQYAKDVKKQNRKGR